MVRNPAWTAAGTRWALIGISVELHAKNVFTVQRKIMLEGHAAARVIGRSSLTRSFRVRAALPGGSRRPGTLPRRLGGVAHDGG
jgi:hypothetical protein